MKSTVGSAFLGSPLVAAQADEPTLSAAKAVSPQLCGEKETLFRMGDDT